jgi:uncharacterized lipoprotein YmbA
MMRRALAMVVLLSGCSFFGKSKSNFFTLDRIAPAGGVSAARGLPIGIDTLELPPGTDRGEVAVRLANQKLDVRGGDQWTASLAPMVLHTLTSDLADRLPEGMVIFPGEAKPLAMRGLDVAFEEFAAGPDARVVADAHWILHEKGRADVTHHEQIAIDIPNLDSANVADGMSKAVAALADRIVTSLQLQTSNR